MNDNSDDMQVSYFSSTNPKNRRISIVQGDDDVTMHFAQIVPPKNRRRSSVLPNENYQMTVDSCEDIQDLPFQEFSSMQIIDLNRRPSHIDRPLTDSYYINPGLIPASRRNSRRRSSVAQLADQGIAAANGDNCLVVTQTLGTSTTYFFQKDPGVEDIDLRPSAKERGIYNYDSSFKDCIPPTGGAKLVVATAELPVLPGYALDTSCATENNRSDNLELPSQKTLRRPSTVERGLPIVKIAPIPVPIGGYNIDKTYFPRRHPHFNHELSHILHKRKHILEEEEKERETRNLVPTPRRSAPTTSPSRAKIHNFDGRQPAVNCSAPIMDELRNQIGDGDVDRIVKEKKTTTLSPTGVPLVAAKRLSVTNSPVVAVPPILDRPYVNDRRQSGTTHQPQGSRSDNEAANRTVTIRTPTTDRTNARSGGFGGNA